MFRTKRKDFYVRLYDNQFLPFTEGVATSIDKLADYINEAHKNGSDPIHVGSDCLDRFKSAWESLESSEAQGINFDFLEPVLQPNPIYLCDMAIDTISKRSSLEDVNPEEYALNPLYLRDADVSMPKRAPRQIAT